MTFHGANLIPESFETGEYKIESTSEVDGLNPLAIIAYSRDPQADGYTQEQMVSKGCYVNGIPSRCLLLCMFIKSSFTTINNDERS